MQLSSGGGLGSWATANGKNKTQQRTPEIRSLRCYLPAPLGSVSQLLHLYGFGDRGSEWTGPAVRCLCVGERVRGAESKEQTGRGTESGQEGPGAPPQTGGLLQSAHDTPVYKHQ